VQNSSDKLLTLGLVGLGLAHELASPLTSAALALELLSEQVRAGASPDVIVAQLDQTVARLHRMGQLISRFRQFAVDPGGLTGPVDLGVVVDGVLALVAPAIKLRSGVRIARLPGAAATVQADRILLEQATACLALNAADVLSPQTAAGEIGVRVFCTADAVGIEVLDDGPGFSDVAAATQLGYTTRTTGMGVGIALARQLVDAFGGTLVLSNRAEGGACARISFTPAS
jgi:two-component system C4-dicarboxylate transport sensor histidine kinase DctB